MNNYTVKEYEFENTLVRYIIADDSKKCFLQLVPGESRRT